MNYHAFQHDHSDVIIFVAYDAENIELAIMM
jgi:hypothetical protein